MPMIDSDEIKHGLQPVQAAEVAYRRAVDALQAAAPEEQEVARARVEQTTKAYDRALLVLYGYVQASLNRAEGRRYDQNE
jgi:hypothetical protein